MPELPEVELVARALEKFVSGYKIKVAELKRERLAPDTSPEKFAKMLRKATIKGIGRRGKHILLTMDNGLTLIVHLRMTGRFMLLSAERELPKFSHAIFYFEDESRLVFQDQRHFGFMRIVETIRADQAHELKKLAPEPLSADFSASYFRQILKTSARNIKELLLDQTKVCGLGNIYAAEALFIARVKPQTQANQVSAVKANRLHRSIKEVLNESIAHGLTANIDPENMDGSYFGGFAEQWSVYGRENEPCRICNHKIKRFKQGGRSSFYCPKCQR